MPRRSSNQRERDFELIASQYLQGVQQYKIAEMLGVSTSQISDDMKELRKRWLASSIRDFDEMKARELAKVGQLEAEYWTAWGRSNDTDPPGDPRYLQGVARCIKARREVLGLDAPQRTVSVERWVGEMSDEELDGEIKRLSALIAKG
jgi:hypothetical protein